MAKLADLRSNLSFEEKKEYEKYRSAPERLKTEGGKAKKDKEAAPASTTGADPISDDEIMEVSSKDKGAKISARSQQLTGF